MSLYPNEPNHQVFLSMFPANCPERPEPYIIEYTALTIPIHSMTAFTVHTLISFSPTNLNEVK